MSLSDKITEQYEGTTQKDWEALSVKAVKEFIRELKFEIKLTITSKYQTKAQWIYKRLLDNVNYKIDKLAGDKLI